jgi:hypothetical protein
MNRFREDLFETLCAYVDGELSPDERARVARLVASDEAVARQVAVLQQMSAGVASLAPSAVVVPMPMPKPASRRRFGVLAGIGIAATVAVGAVAAVWWGLDTPQLAQSAALPDAEQDLLSLHDGWIESAGQDTGSASGSHGYAELLASSGLVRVRDQHVRLQDGREIQHAGYLGSNGCKLSLFRLPAQDQINEGLMVEIAAGNSLMKARWTIASTQFVLVARKMDETRFLTIVNTIREFERDRERNANGLVAALEETRRPCLA